MECLWKNFGASIDMFRDAVQLCPDTLWQSEGKFYYLTYHTLIFLDYYLSVPVISFKPLLPYAICAETELPDQAVDDVLPCKSYSREEVLLFLRQIRNKCHDLIMDSSEEKLNSRWIDPAEIDLHGLCPSVVENYTLLEILFYNFRHVQHHVAQMNFILRKEIDRTPDWISHVPS